uniref:Uncharacterized protein n=1 Tax=Anopheles arabiensis TaxID=7173 RepID=A0A182IFR7_ANOAR
ACTTAIRWRWTQNPPKIRLSDYAARSQWQILLTVFESLCLEHPWIVPCKLITQIIYKNSIQCAVFFFECVSVCAYSKTSCVEASYH